MTGSRSTGSRSIALSRKIHKNTVSAIGATSLRLCALCTMPLAWLSTISTRNSTAACMRPGAPEVTLRATSHISQQPSAPSSTEKNTESQWTTDRSTRPLASLFCRWVRWWAM